MPERTTAKRRLRAASGATATLVVLGFGCYAYVHYLGGEEPPRCTVSGEDGTSLTLEPEQAANASTIEAVASARGLPERAVTIAIATAMQESELRNIDYGDRDSLGLFQQRPSQGWGSKEEILDPVYAAGAFYDRLVELPDYLTMPLTEAAQAVQRSAFPDEYAKHEPEAALLAAALTGRAPAALSCALPAPGSGDGRTPVTSTPDEVHARMVREFGDGVQPSGEGARLTVPVPTEADARQGWELAHWSVAHSAELGIERITYGDRVWEAARSSDGWRELTAGDGGGDGSGEETVAGAADAVQLSLAAGE
ncbi:hypothetical protein [Streptomyces hoynatensis]|uniref:hypothetical protein n=1 Tax=Streptomyces hoynatensis TaxID=1141874 RepID=UPI0018801F93|nr:hypothetical protein [Streptomyces hoynatensis]